MSSPACLVKYERTDPGGGGCLSSRASSGSEVHVPVRRTPAVPLAVAAWRRLRDAEDILYWVYCGLWAFAQAFYENDGEIRWYFTAGIAIGMILWNYICSGILKKTIRWVTMRKKGRTEPKRRQSVRDSTKRNRKKKGNRNRSVLPIFFVVAALLTVLTVYTRSLQKADAVYAARVDALQNEVDTEKQRRKSWKRRASMFRPKTISNRSPERNWD